MSQITFSIPDEILLALNASPEVFAARIGLAAAVKLYKARPAFVGGDAQLAKVLKPYFLSHLPDCGVNTLDFSEEES
jgi:hypothetical protein